MQELVYVQTALAHLAMALKLLDRLGANVPAAHVDAALQSLRHEPVVHRVLSQTLDWREDDFAHLDAMVDQIYGRGLPET